MDDGFQLVTTLKVAIIRKTLRVKDDRVLVSFILMNIHFCNSRVIDVTPSEYIASNIMHLCH